LARSQHNGERLGNKAAKGLAVKQRKAWQLVVGQLVGDGALGNTIVWQTIFLNQYGFTLKN
jgi:hypothetical protein